MRQALKARSTSALKELGFKRTKFRPDDYGISVDGIRGDFTEELWTGPAGMKVTVAYSREFSFFSVFEGNVMGTTRSRFK